MPNFSFAITVKTDKSTGEIISVYFRIRNGKARNTIEFGNAIARYNQKGDLLSFRLLGPCWEAIVDRVASNETPRDRRLIKRFMRNAGPQAWVAPLITRAR
jgi:hypothetical protein